MSERGKRRTTIKYRRTALDRALEELAREDKRWVETRGYLWTWDKVLQVETSVRGIASPIVGNIYIPTMTPKKECKKIIKQAVRVHEKEVHEMFAKKLVRRLF